MKALEKLRTWMSEQQIDGVLLGRRDNFTWITEGAQNHVCTNTDAGVAYYLIKEKEAYLFADSSDLPRMKKEQNPLGAEAILVPWYQSMDEAIKGYAKDGKYVSDNGMAGLENVQEKLIRLRMLLSEEETAKYREIGQLCASIVEGVCMDAEPGMSEAEVAAELKCRCLKAGVSPDCVLVGSDERILNYRHPVPTDKKIEKSLMLVLGGEKYGLNISMTRFVYFAPVPEEMEDRMEKCAAVFAGMQLSMKDGLSYADYFANVKKLYAEVDYADEWQMHHQGGPTGYACREFVVSPGMEGQIHLGEAFAWNPTIQGTKCEETTLLTKDGIEILTRSKNWPLIEVETAEGIMTAADFLRK